MLAKTVIKELSDVVKLLMNKQAHNTACHWKWDIFLRLWDGQILVLENPNIKVQYLMSISSRNTQEFI